MGEIRKCMICGAELGAQETFCGSCGSKAPDGAVSKDEPELNYVSMGAPTFRDLPMKWHWWLTRVILMLWAVLGFCWGLVYISGRGLEGYSRGQLIFMGIVEIVFAIFVLVVRKKLVDFRDSAPVYLYLYLILKIVVPILTLIFFELISYVSFGDIVMDLIPTLIFLIINIVYYSKRMSLFEY